ncbi:MAG: OmpA family protein [Vicingaceae bacterium]
MKFTTVLGFLLLFAIAPVHLHAQKSYLDDADHALYKEEKYHEAIEMYKKAYVKESGRDVKAEIIFKIGEAYRLSDQPEQAEVWFEKAIIAQYVDPIARLRLAEVKMQNGKYDEAMVEFQKYAADNPSDPRGKQGIEAAESAQTWMDNPTTYIVEPVVLINSEFYDFSPTFADKRNDELIFTSTREGSTGSDVSEVTGTNFSDLYYTQRDKKGKWSEPVLAGGKESQVNTDASEGSAAFNSRRNTMYFTRCEVEKNGYKGCKIYQAGKQGQGFGTPEEIVIASDSAVVGHPALTPDDKILIFASDMEGGQGGKDLWYIKEEKRNQWSAPINLGPEINTSGDEMFPYVRSNGDLYFASNGHIGMGGLDIYVARNKGEGQWGEVDNMKAPINSSANDFALIFDGENNRGYFTSGREGGRGKDDIWEFSEPPVIFILKGEVRDIETGEPITAATVELVGTDGTTAEVETRSDGTFEFADKGNGEYYLNPNTSYNIAVSKNDYLSAKGKETTVGHEESKIFDHLYELQPITEEPIKLPEILYEFDDVKLTDQAKDSLEILYKTLVDNPNIVIELLANTDSRGSDTYNQKLSQGRAKSVVDYLVSRGIERERMIPKGMGESNLLISDNEINKLPTEEEREAAHQLNRRTEFRIISTDYVPRPEKPEVPDMEDDSGEQ